MEDRCASFFSDKSRNPDTGNKIKKYGPTYNKIAKECFIRYPEEACKEWIAHPNINPFTSREIKVGSATYKDLQKQCHKLHVSSPSRRSMSPRRDQTSPRQFSPTSPRAMSPRKDQISPRQPSPTSPEYKKVSNSAYNRLSKAVGENNTDLIHLITPKISLKESQQSFLLHKAIEGKKVAALNALLDEGVNPNASYKNENLLHWTDFDIIIMEVLIDHGADINAQSHYGATLITSAIYHRLDNLYEVISFLIDRGIDVNVIGRTNDHSSNLHLAVWNTWGNTRIAALLVKSGANLNVENDLGDTPLHVAVRSEDIERVKLLLDAGSDPNIENRDGFVPLCFTTHNEYRERGEQENDLRIAYLLIDYGAKPFQKASNGHAPIDFMEKDMANHVKEYVAEEVKEPEENI